MNTNEVNQELLSFLSKGVTAFHAIAAVKEKLDQEGFQELAESEPWSLEDGGRYYVVRNQSALIAFRYHHDYQGYMMGAAHCDSPSFKIKVNPEMKENGYVKLNVEMYGGALIYPWLDRPLSVAGRIVVRQGDSLVTKLVRVDKDLLMIPSLAIHMDRSANEGHSWNVQTEICPLLGQEGCGSLLDVVAKEAGVKAEDILGHDLYLYVRTPGTVWGAADEFVSAPHLDDLQCVFGILNGFLQAKDSASLPLCCIFDNEETGSLTKQGADSTFLADVIERIGIASGKSADEQMACAANAFLVSGDNAHAVHPTHGEMADPVNKPKMNGGIVIKYHANQQYTSDAVSSAYFQVICKEAGVPVQSFVNRSDKRGGSTLGNLSNRHFSQNAVDIGLPQLAMHSCYETAGTKDTAYLIAAMKCFYGHHFVSDGNGKFSI